ncbi:MAG: class I SAM-dependent methyltransferase [bacterium]
MANHVDVNEQQRIQETAESWEDYWKAALPQRSPPVGRGFLHRLKRFFQRSGSFELAYRLLRKEIGNSEGKVILEAGSGSGELSLLLAQTSRSAVLLDTSAAAVQYSNRYCTNENLPAVSIRGSIFHLPFRDGVFDASFNVGVLDHFSKESRRSAVAEMLRVTADQGRMVFLTNDRRSWIHPLVMRWAVKKGIWPHGYKAAIASLAEEWRDFPEPLVVREYSRGFISQFEFLRYFVQHSKFWLALFYRLFFLIALPLGVLNVLPGQYRVTVLEKNALSPK